ncbi:MAG: sulfotransferase family protein [Actinomycetes bacterium]
MSSDRPIFVVGCPRSGTTMLSLMIHAHPRLAMPPESRFLLKTWRKRAAYGDLSTDEQRMKLAKACVRTGSKVRDLGLDPEETLEKILAGPPTMGSAFGIIFREFALKHGKERWGDKRPAYYQEVDVLLRLFPDAQIVHIVRDGRANVASLKKMPWWPYDSIGSMAAWSQAEYCARRNQRRLPEDTFHLVRYESLVADPKAVLGDLCDFLEEDFHEAMLEPSEVRAVVPEKKVWHGNLAQSVNTDQVESWRKGLEPWELGLMERVLRRKLLRYEYEISGAGERPSPKLVAKYARDSFERRSAMRKRWAEERREAETTTYPVAARLTTRQLELAATAS